MGSECQRFASRHLLASKLKASTQGLMRHDCNPQRPSLPPASLRPRSTPRAHACLAKNLQHKNTHTHTRNKNIIIAWLPLACRARIRLVVGAVKLHQRCCLPASHFVREPALQPNTQFRVQQSPWRASLLRSMLRGMARPEFALEHCHR